MTDITTAPAASPETEGDLMRITRRRRTAAVALAATAALALSGCLAGDGGSESGGEDDSEVLIYASMDPPVIDGLQSALDAKAEGEDFTVRIEAVEDINSLIMQRIQAGDTPDIAMIPQPGVVRDVVDRAETTVPLDDVVDTAALEESMTPGTLDVGTVDGTPYGLLVSMNVKSLVFYNKPAWEKAGYPTPATIDELNQLTEQIKADGETPWCMGIEDGGATGWAATDWFEDLIMKYGGAEDYNAWVAHEIPFDSDLVRQAAEEFETLLFPEGNTLGGQQAIASTNFGTASNPMFKAQPDCWMYKQGSFMTGFFTESAGVKDLDKEVGVFGFPPVEEGGDNPVLGGGDMAVMMTDDEPTATVMEWLAEPEIGEEAAPNSSFISPHTTFDTELYPTELTKEMADVAYNSTAFLFDGSDQMPGEVGAGTFWKEITAWISGQTDLDTALQNIDESWPSS
jgi:alpha-glucoside transport system substrate-binding protein